MVTTFAEYLLAAREGSFEMRPVSHNLISLCCSLSLSYQPTGLGKVCKKFPLVVFILWRQGSVKLQELCAGIVSGLPFTQEREGGSSGLDGVGRVEEAAGKCLPLKLRAVKVELTAGFPACNTASRVRRLPFCSLCLWVDSSPRQDFAKISFSLKENQLKIIHS